MREIYLESTAAIGDAAMASGLVPPLHESGYEFVNLLTRPFICPLWEGIPGVKALPFDEVPEDRPVIDISAYLGNQFEPECQGLHLVELQAVEVKKKRGPEIFPSPDDVRVVLTKEELIEGKRAIAEISRENRDLPVVTFAPRATTKNRGIPEDTLQAVVSRLSGRVASCVLQPPQEGNLIEGATTFWEWDLRSTAAFLAAAKVVVAIDSAQLHMVNGVLQGSKDTMDEIGLNTRQDKVVVVLGSGPETAVVYGTGSGYPNQVVMREESACDIYCRAYGYDPDQEKRLKELFERDFYPSGVDGDRSLCQYHDYPDKETARCMKSIDPNEIVKAVLQALVSS